MLSQTQNPSQHQHPHERRAGRLALDDYRDVQIRLIEHIDQWKEDNNPTFAAGCIYEIAGRAGVGTESVLKMLMGRDVSATTAVRIGGYLGLVLRWHPKWYAEA